MPNLHSNFNTPETDGTLFPQSYVTIKASQRARYEKYHKDLHKASVEEDVKAAYRAFYSLPQDSSQRHDLYTPQVLFEFKYDKNFSNLRIRAEVLAQLLYYVHRLKFDAEDKDVPPFLCMADVNETVLTETISWQSFCDDSKYDWEAAPSSPDTLLLEDLVKTPRIDDLNVLHPANLEELQILDDTFKRIYSNDIDKSLIIKRDITERNFENIYQNWFDKFGEDVRNGYKPSQYFICDIQEGKSYVRQDTGRVYFDIEDGISRNKKLNLKQYLAFWQLFNKSRSIDTIRGILAKADRLSEEVKRRFEGEFYTPIHLARKAIDYLNNVCGGELHHIDWESGNYRLWDMACGTGNLEYYLPSKAYQYCYMSTLHSEDVVFCKGMFHDATVFQYDYLNDDIERLLGQNMTVGWKMPQQLQDDLANSELTWIIFINPPFGTAQNKMNAAESKRSISMTRVQKHMTDARMGETSRELFSQFLYRIHYEFQGKKAWLGLFSTLKYLNANNDQRLRDTIFRYQFEKGFIFESSAFDVNPGFPIGFLVWNLQLFLPDFDHQHIVVEKCHKNGEAYDTKQLNVIDRRYLINKWLVRPAATKVFPPFSSALNVNAEKTDLRDRIASGFICSLCSKGNDFQNNNYVALFSGPYGSAGAFSVTPDNFLKSMIIHAVRKTAKGDWSNDRDQCYKPYVELFHDEVVCTLGYVAGVTPEFPMDFARDCVVWSLFASSNNCVAMKDVKYKGETYQIHNNLFPFSIQQVRKWGIQDPDIAITISAESEERFAAQWISENQGLLSKSAIEVLETAQAVYQCYFMHLNVLHTTKYKIHTWDAGHYQIIHAMKEAELGLDAIEAMERLQKKLGEKIREQIYSLGFLR